MVTNIYISELVDHWYTYGLGACSVPNHCQNQCWWINCHLTFSETWIKTQKDHWKSIQNTVFKLSTRLNMLIQRGWMTHICVSNLIIIRSDNGLSPGRRKVIIWTNGGIVVNSNIGKKRQVNEMALGALMITQSVPLIISCIDHLRISKLRTTKSNRVQGK